MDLSHTQNSHTQSFSDSFVNKTKIKQNRFVENPQTDSQPRVKINQTQSDLEMSKESKLKET